MREIVLGDFNFNYDFGLFNFENETIVINDYCAQNGALVLSCVINPAHPFSFQRCASAAP